MPQQDVGRIAIGGRQRDSDAGSQDDLTVADVERLSQSSAQAVHEGHHIAERCDVGQSDRELVAVDACNDISVPREVLDAASEIMEDTVAAVALQRFVEFLEAVDVEADKRQVLLVGFRPLKGMVETISKRGPVRKTGQRVVLL